MSDSKEEDLVLKGTRDAVNGLKGLNKEIRGAVKKYQKDALPQEKAKALTKKILAFMSKQAKVTALQHRKEFDALSPEAQAKVVWLDGVVNEMNTIPGDLPKALRLAKKPADDPNTLKILIKETKRLKPQIKQPPKGLGTLVKHMVKDDLQGHPEFGGYSLLPLMILMWLIVDTITRGLKTKR